MGGPPPPRVNGEVADDNLLKVIEAQHGVEREVGKASNGQYDASVIGWLL